MPVGSPNQSCTHVTGQAQAQSHTENPDLESFLATSPPVEPNYPNFPGSPVHNNRANQDIKPLTPTRGEPHRTSRTLSDTPVPQEEQPRVSKFRVLKPALPYIHAHLL